MASSAVKFSFRAIKFVVMIPPADSSSKESIIFKVFFSALFIEDKIAFLLTVERTPKRSATIEVSMWAKISIKSSSVKYAIILALRSSSADSKRSAMLSWLTRLTKVSRSSSSKSSASRAISTGWYSSKRLFMSMSSFILIIFLISSFKSILITCQSF